MVFCSSPGRQTCSSPDHHASPNSCWSMRGIRIPRNEGSLHAGPIFGLKGVSLFDGRRQCRCQEELDREQHVEAAGIACRSTNHTRIFCNVKVTEMSSLLPEPHFMLCLEPVYKLLAAAIPTSAQTPVLMFMP
ncbi:hypothetical protein VFPPC_05972 [Pochonia chlamydosporia 170]|uniref:Uncharacterized protein n=1 Tax=Pochonia chlamydosporia 170 TaxID=1380566 RepID=A0A179FH54_METCM|nr:hypothetical protein VFPPC_05972 [Pochonia chlamydosporia 170]OAQ64737.2 hypothetical protein VFPPC_05972 [Pochonia chlamydosporia 170]